MRAQSAQWLGGMHPPQEIFKRSEIDSVGHFSTANTELQQIRSLDALQAKNQQFNGTRNRIC